jgi:hypothetical protein
VNTETQAPAGRWPAGVPVITCPVPSTAAQTPVGAQDTAVRDDGPMRMRLAIGESI